MSERLQKVLANLGLGSRRAMEDWISEGRVSVNGKVAILGTTVDGSEKILIDGKPVKIDDAPLVRRIIAYHKPIGEVTTRNDPEGRKTVFESLPPIKNGRWISIGRLDINTQGLLLLTNDGEFANKMMHPSSEVEREYAVRVLGTLTEEMVTAMKTGVEFEDGISKFDDILYSGGEGANIWYHVILKGGKNREVRRLWESQGLTVSRLMRIRYGSYTMPKALRQGHSIDLDIDATKAILEDAKMPFRIDHFYVAPDNKKATYKAKSTRKPSSGAYRTIESRAPEHSESTSSAPTRSNTSRPASSNRIGFDRTVPKRPVAQKKTTTTLSARTSFGNAEYGRPAPKRSSAPKSSRPSTGGKSFDRSSRSDSGKPTFDRSSSSRSNSGKPTFDRSSSSRSDSGKPSFDRSSSSRSSSSRSDSGKPSFDRSSSSRSDSGKPTFDRSSSSRSNSGKPSFDRSSSSRSSSRSTGSNNRRYDRD